MLTEKSSISFYSKDLNTKRSHKKNMQVRWTPKFHILVSRLVFVSVRLNWYLYHMYRLC